MEVSKAEALSKERLKRNLGPAVMGAFEIDDVTEVYVNGHDLKLRVDSHSRGRYATGDYLNPGKIRQFLGGIARMNDAPLNREVPSVNATLPKGEPFNRARLFGYIPPYSPEGPGFVLRKPATKMYPLDSYVESGIMSAEHGRILAEAVAERKNIIVAGGTNSGKSTLCNALIELIEDDRLLILEDAIELQPTVPDFQRLTTGEWRNLTGAVKDSLRSRPDRILVGEVRGEEAWDMLDSWRTAHPGGICTVHASTPADALKRIEDLARMKAGYEQTELVLSSIDLVAVIDKTPEGRKLHALEKVTSPKSQQKYAQYLTAV